MRPSRWQVRCGVGVVWKVGSGGQVVGNNEANGEVCHDGVASELKQRVCRVKWLGGSRIPHSSKVAWVGPGLTCMASR